MAAETMMFKLSGATQAAQVPMLAGKSFTVGSTVATGDGMANWLFLHPLGGTGGAGKGMVALKLEGARQAGQLSTLVGQTVTVGKSPVGTTAAAKWLVLHPGAGGMAAKGIGSSVAMQQMGFHATEIEGAAAQKGAAGAAAKGATAGAAAKGAAAGTAVKGGAGKAGALVAKGATGGKGALATGPTMAAGAKSVAGAKSLATGGTIWSGSGTSLGLGLGLGAWGPILLVGAVAAVGVGIYSYMKRPLEETELEEAIS
ncbi:MAG: hypothetical protein HQL96_10900 [Magnetococcales bacterium]|nr:hypothetical protein [Magnetococcales bacterium]